MNLGERLGIGIGIGIGVGVNMINIFSPSPSRILKYYSVLSSTSSF